MKHGDIYLFDLKSDYSGFPELLLNVSHEYDKARADVSARSRVRPDRTAGRPDMSAAFKEAGCLRYVRDICGPEARAPLLRCALMNQYRAVNSP